MLLSGECVSLFLSQTGTCCCCSLERGGRRFVGKNRKPQKKTPPCGPPDLHLKCSKVEWEENRREKKG